MGFNFDSSEHQSDFTTRDNFSSKTPPMNQKKFFIEQSPIENDFDEGTTLNTCTPMRVFRNRTKLTRENAANNMYGLKKFNNEDL